MDLESTSGPTGVMAAAREAEVAPATLSPVSTAVTPGAPDDTTLMLRYRDGDARAFEILYERHKGALYRYLHRTCRNSEAANDLFQEVWSKVITSRARYEVRAQFTTYLFRIAHNAAVDHFRRANRPTDAAADVEVWAEQLPDAVDAQPESRAVEVQLRDSLQRALDSLPAEQRNVFVLYEESGLTLEEIGRLTGVGMETAKSRLRYALGKLRSVLSAYQSENRAARAET
jgi:RNA polymerase sigma-70 factor (ECF subfamily)